jgi:hypothetical protein
MKNILLIDIAGPFSPIQINRLYNNGTPDEFNFLKNKKFKNKINQ